jgi:uncharacterized protein (TIGR02118 family)
VYKVIWLTKLNGTIGRQAADEHWREVHAELMRQVPGVPSIGGPDRYDLHSECWFADEQAYQAAMTTPQWAAVVEDSPKCFDNSELLGAVLEERVMVDTVAVGG